MGWRRLFTRNIGDNSIKMGRTFFRFDFNIQFGFGDYLVADFYMISAMCWYLCIYMLWMESIKFLGADAVLVCLFQSPKNRHFIQLTHFHTLSYQMSIANSIVVRVNTRRIFQTGNQRVFSLCARNRSSFENKLFIYSVDGLGKKCSNAIKMPICAVKCFSFLLLFLKANCAWAQRTNVNSTTLCK